jgi:hypothetical protein
MSRSKEAHITRHEAGAARCAVRASIFASAGTPRRVLVGIDSDPVVYAIAKGRSSSRAMNSLLRKLGPELLLSGTTVGPLRVASLQNPADAPSRLARVRTKPIENPAPWARRFVAGNIGALSLAPQLAGPRVVDDWLDQLPPTDS